MLTLTRSSESVQREVARLAARYIAEIDAQIGEVRRQFITALPGQEMIYLEKEVEARALLSAPQVDLADYPFIAAEVGITGETGEQVAQVILNLAAQWRVIGSGLERLRISMKDNLQRATSVAQVEAAMSIFRASVAAGLKAAQGG